MKKHTLLVVALLVALPFSQRLKAEAVAVEPISSDNIFHVVHPDFKKSPYTGMTRQHWKDAALYILKGAFSYIQTMDDAMKFPKQPGVSYPKDPSRYPTEKLEGLCRTLFYASPLLMEDPDLTINGIKVAEYYRYQIGKLIDPTSPSYIKPQPKGGGPSQNLVEFGALAVSMFAAPHVLWDPLRQSQKDSLAAVMLSYGDGKTVPSNWKFFNIFVLSFFDQRGYAVNKKLLEEYLNKSLEHYRGEGWYNDNPAYDYYSMWAFQMYGIVWAQYYGDKEYPEIALKFREYFKPLKDNYAYMFSRDGKMIMWGRSMSYRYGSVVPFPLMGFEKDPSTNYGWMRRIASGVLLQFLQHPEFLKDNVPTLGFYGPFEPAVQGYSCRGSVYWSGKVFFGLMVPESNPFWSATENEGAWETEMADGKVKNHFSKGSEILVTDYPEIGASEIRAWCNVPIKNNWEKFRGSENYNRLSYNSAFPWQADGPKGEVAMAYVFKNAEDNWEPLRVYTFRKFENGVYFRDAVLESNPDVKMQLADMPLDQGILRIDLNDSRCPVNLRLGHYALPQLNKPVSVNNLIVKGRPVKTLDNGTYQLALIPLQGFDIIETMIAESLHPEAKRSLVMNVADAFTPSPNGPKLYATLMLWKKSGQPFTKKELSPVKKLSWKASSRQVEVTLTTGEKKVLTF